MAYKQNLLQRYHKNHTENQVDNNEIHEKFSRLEQHIQHIKEEINLKTNFTIRANKLEQVFNTIKIGINVIMDDLKLMGNLRKTLMNEIKQLEQCIHGNTLILQDQGKLMAEKTKKFNNNHSISPDLIMKRDVDSSAVKCNSRDGLNGKYWKSSKYRQQNKKPTKKRKKYCNSCEF